MREIRYADQGMDIKKLVLCFVGKIWVVCLAAVLGASFAVVLYTMFYVVPESEREYQTISKVYLDFATDETGEVYQAYNGYTWNDLMATDPILDVTMSYLPEDYTREEVIAATQADILSDLRLLTITITTHEQDRCDDITWATQQALMEFGNTAKEFTNIEIIQSMDALHVVADDRTTQAALIGLAMAVILLLLSMMFYYVLDDRILVVSDLRKVTDLSFVGYSGAGEKLNGEYEGNLAYLREKTGTISVLTVMQEDEISQEKWQELCASDGVVVSAVYGKAHIAYLAYVIEQLKVRECHLVGVAIGSANERFLRRYYGFAIGEK